MDLIFLILRSIALAAVAGVVVLLASLAPLFALGYTDAFGQALAAVLAIVAAVFTLVWTYPKARSDLI